MVKWYLCKLFQELYLLYIRKNLHEAVKNYQVDYEPGESIS